MKKYTYCVWDFNGTILDDVDLGIGSINILLREQGLPIISSREEYRSKFDFPIKDYYTALGFDYDKESYESLAKKWVEIYLGNLKMATLFDDVIEALDFFEKKGIRQIILSASESNMLNSQLDALGIKDRFDEVLGIDNIFADSKIGIAQKWRSEHADERVLFIGDTVHDCEAAKVLCADCFVIYSGHQSKERLSGVGAQLFPSRKALIRYLEKII